MSNTNTSVGGKEKLENIAHLFGEDGDNEIETKQNNLFENYLNSEFVGRTEQAEIHKLLTEKNIEAGIVESLMPNFCLIRSVYGEDALKRSIEVYDVIEDEVLKDKAIENLEKLMRIDEYIILNSGAFGFTHLGQASKNFINDLLKDNTFNKIYEGLEEFPDLDAATPGGKTNVLELLDKIGARQYNELHRYSHCYCYYIDIEHECGKKKRGKMYKYNRHDKMRLKVYKELEEIKGMLGPTNGRLIGDIEKEQKALIEYYVYDKFGDQKAQDVKNKTYTERKCFKHMPEKKPDEKIHELLTDKNIKLPNAGILESLIDNFFSIARCGQEALDTAIKVYKERVDGIEDEDLKNKIIENFQYLFNVYDKSENKKLTLDKDQIEKLMYINERIKSGPSKFGQGWDLGKADKLFINDALKDGNLDKIRKGFEHFPDLAKTKNNVFNNNYVGYLLNKIAKLRFGKLLLDSCSKTDQAERLELYKELEDIQDMSSNTELIDKIKREQIKLILKVIKEEVSKEIIQQIDNTCDKELTYAKYFDYGYWEAYFVSFFYPSNEDYKNYCYTEKDLNVNDGDVKAVTHTNLYEALNLYTKLNATLTPYTNSNKLDSLNPSPEDLSKIYQLNTLCDKINTFLIDRERSNQIHLI